MKYDQKERKLLKAILISAILMSMVLMISPNAFSESASAPTLIINKKMAPRTDLKSGPAPIINARTASRTGRIDRIGKKDIVIDDTWFKLSDNVSAGGYKVGTRVTYIATDKYEILEISHAKKKRLPKE